MGATRSICYVITEDWFFWSHFVNRAVAALEAGFDVSVATNVGAHGDKIRSLGLRIIPIPWVRRKVHPGNELKVMRKLAAVFRAERPVIVHNIALKPMLYGTAAARLTGVENVINAPVGLGYMYLSNRLQVRLVRPAVSLALRLVLRSGSSRIIFENPDNLSQFVHAGVVEKRKAVLIRGAGVDIEKFSFSAEPVEGAPVVTLVARMLWTKGVGEFADAARILKERGLAVRFVLVGSPDEGNPSTVPEEVLRGWNDEGVLEWWGQREDIARIMRESHVVVLPSYGEGLPKCLLEAAACGRPIVTTNAPGCREIVRDGDNGILVPVADVEALAGAIEKLVRDPDLRQRMGARGRQRVEAEFSEERVIRETLAVYEDLLSGYGPT